MCVPEAINIVEVQQIQCIDKVVDIPECVDDDSDVMGGSQHKHVRIELVQTTDTVKVSPE